MRLIFAVLAAAIITASTRGQGTIEFNNRGLSPAIPGGPRYDVPIWPITDIATARGQLVLVTLTETGPTFTPLQPLQTLTSFFPSPHFMFFSNGLMKVAVDGQPAGTKGAYFVVRVWEKAASYETATNRAQSGLIRVDKPLGGTTAEGVTYEAPDLGGPNGFVGMSPSLDIFHFNSIAREQNQLRLNVFAWSDAAWLSAFVIEGSTDLQNWSGLATNALTGEETLTIPSENVSARYFRMRGQSDEPAGTIVFHNRNLSSPVPGGSMYHAPVVIGDPENSENSHAQLYLVTTSGLGGYTPLFPRQRFSTAPGTTEFFREPVIVSVSDKAPGTTGVQFVVRAWAGAPSYETAAQSMRISSDLITVHQPLGGTTADGLPITAPDLGGPDGLRAMSPL